MKMREFNHMGSVEAKAEEDENPNLVSLISISVLKKKFDCKMNHSEKYPFNGETGLSPGSHSNKAFHSAEEDGPRWIQAGAEYHAM